MSHIYDVEFYNRDGSLGAAKRVPAEGIEDAIKVAGKACADAVFRGACWGTKVTLVDDEAEAKEREDNAHLYEMADVARDLFVRYGFADQNNGWYRHEATGLYAGIDHHSKAEYSRFTGVYQHQIAPSSLDVMVSVGLIPWYGDGAPADEAESLLEALLQTVTK